MRFRDLVINVVSVCLIFVVVSLSAARADMQWVKVEKGCPEEWSIQPINPSERDIIYFSGPTGIHGNECDGMVAGGGTPTILIDEAGRKVELWFEPPAPEACITLYDPVCGLEGTLGRLVAGDWTFYSNSPITKFSIPFSIGAAETLCVTAMEPAPGSILEPAPEEIVVTFSDDVVSTSVNAKTFLLEQINGEEITAASIEYVPTMRQAKFDITGVSMPKGMYRVTLVGDVDAINERDAAILALGISEKVVPLCICDISGEALDGEFKGLMPSGDGRAGGDFVATFSIGKGPRKSYWMVY